jgi:peptidoglycan hydrolase-like protein with peptidoglycan-binding domain
MGLWKYGLAGASCCFVAAVASAQTPATAAPAAVASSRADSQNVRNAQQTLEALKLDPGPADGMLGPRTKAAVKRFQEAEKLSATGTLDAQTRARLAERRREHVVQLQKALKETGHDPGPADGVMGSQTRAAVRRYASAPAPSSQSGPSEVIARLQRAYEASLQQSP